MVDVAAVPHEFGRHLMAKMFCCALMIRQVDAVVFVRGAAAQLLVIHAVFTIQLTVMHRQISFRPSSASASCRKLCHTCKNFRGRQSSSSMAAQP